MRAVQSAKKVRTQTPLAASETGHLGGGDDTEAPPRPSTAPPALPLARRTGSIKNAGNLQSGLFSGRGSARRTKEIELWFTSNTVELPFYWECKPLREKWIQFDVQTACDAVIALSSHHIPCLTEQYQYLRATGAKAPETTVPLLPKRFPDLYEVVFGAEKNSAISIRRGFKGAEIARVAVPKVLSDIRWRSFWIRTSDGQIEIGRKGQTESLLCLADPALNIKTGFMAYYSAYGSRAASWRFYKPAGLVQRTLGSYIVFSYSIPGPAYIGKPYTITLHGTNLPHAHDRMKVVPATQHTLGYPVAGSHIATNLAGTTELKTAEFVFNESVLFPLMVCYDPGNGVFEEVRPHRQNKQTLRILPVELKVSRTSQRLLKPRTKFVPAPLKTNADQSLTADSFEKMIDRLYTQSRVHDTTTAEKLNLELRKPLCNMIQINNDTVQKLAERLVDQERDRNKTKMDNLIKKYVTPPPASPKLKSGEELEEYNTRFFYSPIEFNKTSRQRLILKYLGVKPPSSSTPSAPTPTAKISSSSTGSKPTPPRPPAPESVVQPSPTPPDVSDIVQVGGEESAETPENPSPPPPPAEGFLPPFEEAFPPDNPASPTVTSTDLPNNDSAAPTVEGDLISFNDLPDPSVGGPPASEDATDRTAMAPPPPPSATPITENVAFNPQEAVAVVATPTAPAMSSSEDGSPQNLKEGSEAQPSPDPVNTKPTSETPGLPETAVVVADVPVSATNEAGDRSATTGDVEYTDDFLAEPPPVTEGTEGA